MLHVKLPLHTCDTELMWRTFIGIHTSSVTYSQQTVDPAACQFHRAGLLAILIVWGVLLSGCRESGTERYDGFSGFTDGGELMLRHVNVIGNTDDFLIGDIGSTVVSPSNELWIADFSNGLLWTTTSDGDSVRTLGGKGQGPGEFSIPISLAFSGGDTLFVLDVGQHRLTAFGPHPERDFLFATYIGHNMKHGRIPGAVIGSWRDAVLLMDAVPATETSNPVLTLFGVNHDGRVVFDSLLQINGPEIHLERPRPGHMQSIARPFGRKTVYAFDGERVCHGWTEYFIITCTAQDGSEEVVLSFDLPSRPVDASEIQQNVETMLTENRRMVENAGWHRTHPAIDALTIGVDGRYWIHRPPYSPDGSWFVFDIEGGTYQRGRLPEGQRVVAATDRYVFTSMAPARPDIWIYEIVE